MANVPQAHSSRDLFPGHGAGKGDAERSPGWRENYPTIEHMTGVPDMVRIGPGRFRKVYGPRPITPEYVAQPIAPVTTCPHVVTHRYESSGETVCRDCGALLSA